MAHLSRLRQAQDARSREPLASRRHHHCGRHGHDFHHAGNRPAVGQVRGDQNTAKPDTSLREARQLMKDRVRDFLVVTEANDDRRLAGLVTQRSIDRALEAEIARRRGHSEVPAVA
ncbi:MAG: CBS domain-containing protein [candidate division WOR-3 bacterium]|nr:CBS domain-containing protein [candidate division WOR-3 bacterium]